MTALSPLGAKFLYDVDLDSGPAVWINGKPTGIVNSYVGAVSFGIKCLTPGLDGTWQIQNCDGLDFDINLLNQGTPEAPDFAISCVFELEPTEIGSDWEILIQTPGIEDGECHHVQFSWDSNHPAGEKIVTAAYDGAPAEVTHDDFGDPHHELRLNFELLESVSIGMTREYQTTNTIALAEYWLQTDTYIDFSQQANIDKFYNATTGFTDLGADGSLPTGSPPLFYLSVRQGGAANDFLTNRGSSDDFVNGGTGFGGDPLLLDDPFCPAGDGASASGVSALGGIGRTPSETDIIAYRNRQSFRAHQARMKAVNKRDLKNPRRRGLPRQEPVAQDDTAFQRFLQWLGREM